MSAMMRVAVRGSTLATQTLAWDRQSASREEERAFPRPDCRRKMIPATGRSEGWSWGETAKETGAARRYVLSTREPSLAEPAAPLLAGQGKGPWPERQPFIKARDPGGSLRLGLQGWCRCGWDGGMTGIAGASILQRKRPVRLVFRAVEGEENTCRATTCPVMRSV